MNRRWLWIILGVIAFFGVLCVGAAAGIGGTYLFLQNRNAQIGINLPFRVEPFGRQSEPVITDKAGFLIITVVPDSPAGEAGLESGDLIVSIENEMVKSDQSLEEIIHSHQPGDQIALEVLRGEDEESRELEVTLGEHPDNTEQAYLGVEYRSIPDMRMFEKGEIPYGGFMLPESGEGSGQMFEFPFGELPFSHDFPSLPEGVEQAVIVGEVTQDSPAEQAGLKPGDVITNVDGEPVEGTEALIDLVQNKDPGDEITLTVYRSGEESSIEVEVVLGENPDQDDQAYLGVSITGFIRIDQDNPNLPESFDFDFDQFPWPNMPEQVEPGEEA
jgi:C-terminal processing protease CtpA/Prc